jgi:hypothetical protein
MAGEQETIGEPVKKMTNPSLNVFPARAGIHLWASGLWASGVRGWMGPGFRREDVREVCSQW